MSDEKQHLKLIRLDARRRTELFRRLEGEAAAASAERAAHEERRTGSRWEYRREVWLEVERPGGGLSRFAVLTRNLSADGLAFIHGDLIDAATPCRLTLPRRDLGEQEVSGRVTGSRHLEGALHEVRLRFDQPIDPTIFVGFGDQAVPAPPDERDLARVHGRVLYLRDAAVNGHLLDRHLAATRIEVRRVASADEAVEAMRSEGPEAFETVLADLTLDGLAGASVVKRLRNLGFEGAVVVMTAEPDEDRLAAISAGADHVLRKPFRPEELYLLLIRLHLQESSGEVIYSTIDPDPDVVEMIEQYIDHARQIAERLDRALEAENLDQLRAACLSLRGSAAGYGFEALGDAASEALRLIDGRTAARGSLDELRRLAVMCRRLAIRDLKGAEAAAGELPGTVEPVDGAGSDAGPTGRTG